MSPEVCLALVLWYEIRGGDDRSKRLVAETVISRTLHKDFPDSVCGVTTQPGQFSSYARKGIIPKEEGWEEMLTLSDSILRDKIELPGVYPTYFWREELGNKGYKLLEEREGHRYLKK